MKLNLDQLRELIQLLETHDLTEIEVEHDDDRIRVRREPAPSLAATAPVQPSAAAPHSSGAETRSESAAADDAAYVTSPFVGTFYRSPSPEGEPFVEVGDEIAPGQVLCIVEAMKLMNEIEAEIAGRVVEVLVENGKPVEYGDRLFRVEDA